jgi:hypothetical protein
MKVCAEMNGMRVPRDARSKRLMIATGKRWLLAKTSAAAAGMQGHDLDPRDAVFVIDLRELDDPQRTVFGPGVDLWSGAAEGPDGMAKDIASSHARTVLAIVDRIGLEGAGLGDDLFEVQEPRDRGLALPVAGASQGLSVRSWAIEITQRAGAQEVVAMDEIVEIGPRATAERQFDDGAAPGIRPPVGDRGRQGRALRRPVRIDRSQSERHVRRDRKSVRTCDPLGIIGEGRGLAPARLGVDDQRADRGADGADSDEDSPSRHHQPT